ncbi:hypothetical protein AVEN_178114-1, partial [Araneus ventricosus]
MPYLFNLYITSELADPVDSLQVLFPEKCAAQRATPAIVFPDDSPQIIQQHVENVQILLVAG